MIQLTVIGVHGEHGAIAVQHAEMAQNSDLDIATIRLRKMAVYSATDPRLAEFHVQTDVALPEVGNMHFSFLMSVFIYTSQ